MSVKVRKMWESETDAQRPLPLYVHILGEGGSRVILDTLPMTGRVVVHLDGGRLMLVESFEDGPSRRNPRNSKRRDA